MLRKDKTALRKHMSQFVDGFKGGAVQKPRRDGGSPGGTPNTYSQVNVKAVRGKSR